MNEGLVLHERPDVRWEPTESKVAAAEVAVKKLGVERIDESEWPGEVGGHFALRGQKFKSTLTKSLSYFSGYTRQKLHFLFGLQDQFSRKEARRSPEELAELEPMQRFAEVSEKVSVALLREFFKDDPKVEVVQAAEVDDVLHGSDAYLLIRDEKGKLAQVVSVDTTYSKPLSDDGSDQENTQHKQYIYNKLLKKMRKVADKGKLGFAAFLKTNRAHRNEPTYFSASGIPQVVLGMDGAEVEKSLYMLSGDAPRDDLYLQKQRSAIARSFVEQLNLQASLRNRFANRKLGLARKFFTDRITEWGIDEPETDTVRKHIAHLAGEAADFKDSLEEEVTYDNEELTEQERMSNLYTTSFRIAFEEYGVPRNEIKQRMLSEIATVGDIWHDGEKFSSVMLKLREAYPDKYEALMTRAKEVSDYLIAGEEYKLNN